MSGKKKRTPAKKKQTGRSKAPPRKAPPRKAPPRKKDGGFSTNSGQSGEQVNLGREHMNQESNTPWLDGLGSETMYA